MAPDRRQGTGNTRPMVSLFRDKTRRAVLFTMVSIPGTLLMATWKAALFVVAPSLFLLATVIFTVGVAVAKAGVIRSHVAAQRRQRASGTVDATDYQRRTYRATGLMVLVLSGLYTLSFLPFLLGDSTEVDYGRELAIIIAAVTFGELILAVHGTISARRNSDLLTEAVKLTNLAAGLILLTLTQSALLSLEPTVNAGNANAISGLVFGSLAAAVGGWMLWRSRVATSTDLGAGSTAAAQ